MFQILTIDDDPICLGLITQILQNDYKIVPTDSYISAITLLQTIKFDLVLSDIHLSPADNTGYRISHFINQHKTLQHIPIIFMTAFNNSDEELASFNAGAVDFISKPINEIILRARLKAHLSRVTMTRLDQSKRDAIHMLGKAGHYNDTDTGLHIWRMAAFAKEIASTMGWSKEQCELIELAAPMHDVGKIGIPASILRKPGRLNDDERLIMQTHTNIGYDILRESADPLFLMAADIALNHHEQWIGVGYPNAIVGAEIPESARIVSVADVFDALSVKRAYKDAWAKPDVIKYIVDGAGSLFDPTVIHSFLIALPKLIQIQDSWQEKTHLR